MRPCMLFDSNGSGTDLVRKLNLDPKTIHHIRRVLLTCSAGGPNSVCEAIQTFEPIDYRARSRGDLSKVTVIIPTRDRLDLLKRCVESVIAGATPLDLEILIIDNDSVKEETKVYFTALAESTPFRVLPISGQFNFSRLCNQAAAQARGDVIIFLNNDTEIVDRFCFGTMSTEALEPNVGAVGTKLLYPDGRVQHSGIVLGVDGLASHFEIGT